MKITDLAMKIADLKNEMDAQFGAVGSKFAAVDAKFAAVDARFAAVDARFADVDARFDAVDTQFQELRTLIAAEGRATRTHFDVIADQLRTEINLGLDKSMATGQQVAGLTAINAQDHMAFARTLENHELRLKALESRESEST